MNQPPTITPTPADILPCPYCGNEGIPKIRKSDYTNAPQVICIVCICSGPSKFTEAEAIAAWNEVAGLKAKLAEAERYRDEFGKLCNDWCTEYWRLAVIKQGNKP